MFQKIVTEDISELLSKGQKQSEWEKCTKQTTPFWVNFISKYSHAQRCMGLSRYIKWNRPLNLGQLRSQLPGLTSFGPLRITDPLRMNSSLHQKDWPLDPFCMLNNGFMHKAYGTFPSSVCCGYAKISHHSLLRRCFIKTVAE